MEFQRPKDMAEWEGIKWQTRRLAAYFGPEVEARLNPPPHLVSIATPRHSPQVLCWLDSCALHPRHPIDRCLEFNLNMDATQRAIALRKDARGWSGLSHHAPRWIWGMWQLNKCIAVSTRNEHAHCRHETIRSTPSTPGVAPKAHPNRVCLPAHASHQI